MRTIVSLGECLIDLVSTTIGPLTQAASFEMAAGGAPAAVAACVARLGGKSAFIGMRGKDAFGDFLNRTLLSCGVDTTYFHTVEHAPTALAFVSLDGNGDRTFAFYRQPCADVLLSKDNLPVHFIQSSGILHVGSVSLAIEPARTATIEAMKLVKQVGGYVSYDPNWRPPLWNNHEEALQLMKDVLQYVDLVKVNREEMELLANTSSVKMAAQYFHAQGAPLVLITLDAEGCFYSYHCEQTSFSGLISGVPVKCLDTTGAGDTFMGGFLYHLALSNLRFTEDQVQEWVRFAVYASALVTLRRGSIPALPSLEQVVSFMKTTKDECSI